jgi:hypothetical protein
MGSGSSLATAKFHPKGCLEEGWVLARNHGGLRGSEGGGFRGDFR